MIAGQRPQPLSLKRANTTKDLWSEPSSPATTFSSLSWAAEKSATELAGLLRNAHASLREKEKDLTLAAELGHYLLENNAALKSQYEALLQQRQQQDDIKSTTDDNDQDDLVDEDRQLCLLSQQQAHQRALSDLQEKNMDLQLLLEDAQQQSDKLQMVHDRKARELEYDITLLKDHLDLATRHIEEMEQERHYKSNLRQDHHHPYKQRRCQNDQDEARQRHEAVLADLQTKIRQLEYENSQLVHTRQSVQERLDRALYDVNALQHQFNIGQWTREGYAQLNDAYQRQFSHIAQLNISLEEHRHTLTHLVEHGTILGHHDNHHHHLALSHSSSSAATTLESTDDRPLPFCHTDAASLMNNNNSNNTLMAELEKAWHRNQAMTPDIGTTQQQQQQQHWRIDDGADEDDDDDDDNDDGYSSLPDSFKQQHGSTYFTDTSCFYMPSPRLSHAFDDHDDDNSNSYSERMATMNEHGGDNDDDLFGPLDSSDIKTSYNLYPGLISRTTAHAYPTGLLVAGQSKVHPIGMVTKVQRWCRFALVLTVAVFINVFEGPDGILEEKY